MKVNVEKQPKATAKVTITVETDKVKEAYEKVLNIAVQNTEIEGFRKGTAPKEMVKQKVGLNNLYADTVDLLLQTYYPQALKENSLRPVANPRVDIKEFDPEKDFEFTATIALKPEIKVKEFREELKKRYEDRQSNRKKENEERLKKGEKLDDSHIHLGTNDILDVLLVASELEVAEMLIEEETDRLMTRLLNQTQAVGLSIDTYLKSQNKTAEELRKEYDLISERNLKSEFILAKLVEDEKIEVSDEEINEAIAAVGDPEMQKKLSTPVERLYIKSILQKNKLIGKLIEEIEGENHHEH